MHGFISLLSGVLFGLGLMISGMTQPGKVIGFLDIFGDQKKLVCKRIEVII